jgi:hypothetical protein
MTPATVPLIEGAAASVFGTAFFGFFASRLPRFFSVAIISLLNVLRRLEADASWVRRRFVRKKYDRGCEACP